MEETVYVECAPHKLLSVIPSLMDIFMPITFWLIILLEYVVLRLTETQIFSWFFPAMICVATIATLDMWVISPLCRWLRVRDASYVVTDTYASDGRTEVELTPDTEVYAYEPTIQKMFGYGIVCVGRKMKLYGVEDPQVVAATIELLVQQ